MLCEDIIFDKIFSREISNVIETLIDATFEERSYYEPFSIGEKFKRYVEEIKGHFLKEK